MIELPEVFSLIWRDFLNLNSTRTSSGYGVNSISYAEIDAYYKLSGIEPEAWEIEVLKYFDNTLMQLYSDKAEADQAKSKNKK